MTVTAAGHDEFFPLPAMMTSREEAMLACASMTLKRETYLKVVPACG